jgi:ribulose 1,5-bisphosphate synthetase/thiazole synthase
MSSNENLAYSKILPVRYQPDVLVAGGGPAGIAAALAAKSQGLSVRLIEGHSCLGGMGTAGMVPAFSLFTDDINFLADGVGKTIYDALQEAEGAYDTRIMSIRSEVLKRVYDTLLTDAGVDFTFHTSLVDVTVDDGWVSEAVCADKSGLFAIRAKVFIDGTGDGDLAVFAGASYEKGGAAGHMMPGTLCSLWAGIDWEKVIASGLKPDNCKIEQAFKDGVFTLEDRHLPGIWRVGETIGGGNIGHTFELDGTNSESLTQAYIWGRKSMMEYERYYKEYLEGYENMELVVTGSLLGVRETRRITGDYVLDVEDFKTRAVFDDEIGRYCYPVDIHIAKPDKKSYDDFIKEYTAMRMEPGESYGIPYRILTPEKLKNVFVAGRCVSTDRSMQASIRVMPGCFITGQAAGVASALVIESGTDIHEINVRELQSRLKTLGAFLPNLTKNK